MDTPKPSNFPPEFDVGSFYNRDRKGEPPSYLRTLIEPIIQMFKSIFRAEFLVLYITSGINVLAALASQWLIRSDTSSQEFNFGLGFVYLFIDIYALSFILLSSCVSVLGLRVIKNMKMGFMVILLFAVLLISSIGFSVYWVCHPFFN